MTARSDRDHALWQRYRRDQPALPQPNVLDLAAYADSRPTEAEAGEIERVLARDLDLLDAILTARRGQDTAPVPLDIIRRARTLVSAPVGPRRLASWASIAAALVLVCVSGFQAGYSAGGRANDLNQPIELANWTGGDADGLD